jgi:hypothetical protein
MTERFFPTRPGLELPLQVGREIELVERVWLPSGRSRELWSTTLTRLDADGLFRTHQLLEARPPLDCSCVPEDICDVAECVKCGAIVCASLHALTCPGCGRTHCLGCAKIVVVGQAALRLCNECTKELTTPGWLKFLTKLIWG